MRPDPDVYACTNRSKNEEDAESSQSRAEHNGSYVVGGPGNDKKHMQPRKSSATAHNMVPVGFEPTQTDV